MLERDPSSVRRAGATRRTGFAVLAAVVLGFASGPVLAQGGCGSVCIPLEALDPEKTQLDSRQFRFSITTQSGHFDNFREGGDEITNPGGNTAIIQDTTLFLDYGAAPRLTVSLMVPYVQKIQNTNRFGERIAEGIGDLAFFGRYEVLRPREARKPSISFGLGLKFPTGSIEEPGGDVANLPPPFQAGSGAYDLIQTFSYFQGFKKVALFGSTLWRVPLEDNKFGYRFGQEVELHFGVTIPLPVLKGRLEFVVSADYLNGEHDEDNGGILPARLRDGTTVLNTGGEFFDLAPGLRFRVNSQLTLQARMFVAVSEDWNGFRPTNVGQVAPDTTSQFVLSYTID